MKYSLRFLTIPLSIIVIVSCGGGGSSSSNNSDNSTPSQPNNSAPIADAGTDQQININELVTLSGANSSDADNDSLSYLWNIVSQPIGSQLSLSSTDQVEITFTPDNNGEYIIGLIVNDGTNDSSQDTVSIFASSDGIDITDAIFTNKSGSCGDYVGTYYSTVQDIKRTLAFEGYVEIQSNGNHCTFNINQIPNHDFNDNSANFATDAAALTETFQLPVTTKLASTVNELVIGTTEGLFLNGVTLDILPAACFDVGNEALGQEKIGCGPQDNEHPWRYDPMSPLNTFGTDIHNAHTQPNGKYHYHANPVAMFTQECSDAISPVIGFAADGFPIYGSCIVDENTGAIRKAISSYQLKNDGGPRQDVNGYQTPKAGIGNINSDNYDGQFRGDWEFISEHGDLDQCNGMTVDGQYGYYITDSFPWVINCLKGEIDNSFSNSTQVQRRSHSHDDVTHSH